MSKQYGHEDFLADLISKACISILPEKSSFNVDNVRVTKILGSGLLASSVVQVLVLPNVLPQRVFFAMICPWFLNISKYMRFNSSMRELQFRKGVLDPAF